MTKTQLKMVVAALFLAPLMTTHATAQSRPDTLRMTCGMASETVRREGAVILSTGPNIYDRYVSSQAYCQRDEETRPHWLATSDSRQCFIGYVCERKGGDPSPP
ncbi:MAG: hypothetical protein Q7T73_06885 [Beijerinckiaceae bacterium]|nr:hypothetical protein [Beijerinckiaceae bacterium]